MDHKQTNCFCCGRDVSEEREKLMIMNNAMCSGCEKLLINTTANEILYLVFKEKIKKIWFA